MIIMFDTESLCDDNTEYFETKDKWEKSTYSIYYHHNVYPNISFHEKRYTLMSKYEPSKFPCIACFTGYIEYDPYGADKEFIYFIYPKEHEK